MALAIPMTRAAGFGPLPQLLEQRAGRRVVQRVFDAEAIPVQVIEHLDHKLPLASMTAVFEGAARAAGDPILGLRVGQQMPPTDYGLWLAFALQAETLGGMVQRVIDWLHVHQVGGRLELVAAGPGKRKLCYWHPEIGRTSSIQHTDHVLPVIIRLFQGYAGADWTPEFVDVGYAAPARATAREDETQAAWRFAQRGTGIVFPETLLNARKCGVEGHARKQTPITSSEIKAQETSASASGFLEQASAILALRLLGRKTDIDGVARMLGRSRRTLQRNLDAAGTTYSALLDKVRMERARALILETDTPIRQVALDVGYSDAAHFTRAFNRTFGQNPSGLRLTTR